MPDWGTLEFKWPFMLWSLGCWVLWLAWRVLRARRMKQGLDPLGRTVRPAKLQRVTEAAALLLLLLALARPQAVLLQPMRDAAVVFVVDTSLSMKATDVAPNRLEAARQAMLKFIEHKPALLQVGLVSVGGTASLAQVPTLQRDDLIRAVGELNWQNGSALGTGVIIALDALLPHAGIDAQKIIDGSTSAQPGKKVDGQPHPPVVAKNPLDPPRAAGESVSPVGLSRAMVLITDGQGNMGPDLLDMAQWAVKHQVRVYTVGVGTREGALLKEQGVNMRTKLEEGVLRKVAQLTGGEYRKAEDATQLLGIYDDLGHRMKFEKRGISEITHLLALCALILAVLAAALGIGRAGHMG